MPFFDSMLFTVPSLKEVWWFQQNSDNNLIVVTPKPIKNIKQHVFVRELLLNMSPATDQADITTFIWFMFV